MLLYVDTSALMKRYLHEVGSARIAALLQTETSAVSSIVRVEVASTLGRRAREGGISPELRDEIYTQFLKDLSATIVVEADETVLVRAANLVRTSPAAVPLRSLDAIHLASALQVFEDFASDHGHDLAFVTADRQLRRAAEYAGLRSIDPDEPE